MLGFGFAGVFLAIVVASYACTEYQLVLYDAWRRVRLGESFALLIILAANAISFLVLWMSALAFVLASGTHHYTEATAVCAFAQALWLVQNLWAYHRNHLRLLHHE
jgi:hypothetical protein